MDDLTTEQYKVLVYALQEYNKTMKKEHDKAMAESDPHGHSGKMTSTYRIINKQSKGS